MDFIKDIAKSQHLRVTAFDFIVNSLISLGSSSLLNYFLVALLLKCLNFNFFNLILLINFNFSLFINIIIELI